MLSQIGHGLPLTMASEFRSSFCSPARGRKLEATWSLIASFCADGPRELNFARDASLRLPSNCFGTFDATAGEEAVDNFWLGGAFRLLL